MWSARPDNQSCCNGPHGAVADEEDVARLIHSKISNPDRAAFTRKELAADGIEVPSNVCGDADGCSVDRVIDLSDADLVARSEAYAALKEGRVAEGAMVASVGELRKIEHELADERRAVLIYDDPRADNDRHAVLRLCDKIPRSDFKLMQRAVIDAFARKVG